jgi:hypothetical protein
MVRPPSTTVKDLTMEDADRSPAKGGSGRGSHLWGR